ncbi:hypothetical protein F2Q68_00017187 [Brassica cretica]|uniref:Uncharacterized protein n=1 Tax=Brassica cretica TaxID=69181 RepID=A0A8S9HDN7_BRACR|nr:hypothetical protein F2Q68_00017187 [Brassica cretica]
MTELMKSAGIGGAASGVGVGSPPGAPKRVTRVIRNQGGKPELVELTGKDTSDWKLSVLVCPKSGPLLGLNLRRPSIRVLVEFLRAGCFWSARLLAKSTLVQS